MKKLGIVLLAAVVIGVLLSLPAFGGTSGLKKLQKRVNALTRLVVRQDIESTTYTSVGFARGADGLAAATINCPRSSTLTGGGAGWSGGYYYASDALSYSMPTADGNGWTAAGVSSSHRAEPMLEVYAICSSIK